MGDGQRRSTLLSHSTDDDDDADGSEVNFPTFSPNFSDSDCVSTSCRVKHDVLIALVHRGW